MGGAGSSCRVDARAALGMDAIFSRLLRIPVARLSVQQAAGLLWSGASFGVGVGLLSFLAAQGRRHVGRAARLAIAVVRARSGAGHCGQPSHSCCCTSSWLAATTWADVSSASHMCCWLLSCPGTASVLAPTFLAAEIWTSGRCNGALGGLGVGLAIVDRSMAILAAVEGPSDLSRIR